MVRNIIFIIIFISPPFLKRYILRLFCNAKIGRRVYIGWFSAVIGRKIEIGEYSEIRSFSIIKCDTDVKIGKYSIISNFVLVYGASSFSLGNHSYIGSQSLINVEKDVCIGNFSGLGARCMIFTHASFLPYTEGYFVKFAGVTIGDYAWITTGIFIHPGVKIGSNVFINARSVVTDDVCTGEVVDGFPAKRVGYMDKIKRNMTPTRIDIAIWQILNHFNDAVLHRKMGVSVTERSSNCLNFCYRRKEYSLLLITSENRDISVDNRHRRKRVIFLVNQQNWIPPSEIKNPILFDMTTMRTSYLHDKVQKELYLFMKRYYGMQFEYQV